MQLSRNTIFASALGSILGLTILISAVNNAPNTEVVDQPVEVSKPVIKLNKNQAKVLNVYRGGFLWGQRTSIQYSDGVVVQRDGKLGNPGDIVESKRGWLE